MAPRYQRSQVNLSTNNQPRVRPAGVVPHQVPQFVGAMRGINPMAGDMTAAFSNFFGTINRSVQQTVNTFGKIEAQRIADEDLSKLVVFDATKASIKILTRRCNPCLALS